MYIYSSATSCLVGSVGSVPLTQLILISPPGWVIPKTIIKMVQTASCMALNALGSEFGSAAQLFKRPVSVWNCLWGNALKRSPGISRKSRVLYPVPGFLSSATWPSLPKKHNKGLNQIISNFAAKICYFHCSVYFSDL